MASASNKSNCPKFNCIDVQKIDIAEPKKKGNGQHGNFIDVSYNSRKFYFEGPECTIIEAFTYGKEKDGKDGKEEKKDMNELPKAIFSFSPENPEHLEFAREGGVFQSIRTRIAELAFQSKIDCLKKFCKEVEEMRDMIKRTPSLLKYKKDEETKKVIADAPILWWCKPSKFLEIYIPNVNGEMVAHKVDEWKNWEKLQLTGIPAWCIESVFVGADKINLQVKLHSFTVTKPILKKERQGIQHTTQNELCKKFTKEELMQISFSTNVIGCTQPSDLSASSGVSVNIPSAIQPQSQSQAQSQAEQVVEKNISPKKLSPAPASASVSTNEKAKSKLGDVLSRTRKNAPTSASESSDTKKDASDSDDSDDDN